VIAPPVNYEFNMLSQKGDQELHDKEAKIKTIHK
jgi:hypothetical protein